jgi:hypothetical protein
MVNETKSYSQKVVESGVCNNIEDTELSTNDKLQKYGLTRTTYYDYMKLEPLIGLLSHCELSKKQCFELLANYNDLLKSHTQERVLKVMSQQLEQGEATESITNIQQTIEEQLEDDTRPFNSLDKLIKNHYHVIELSDRALPIEPKANVSSNRDMQLFAIALWSTFIQSEMDVTQLVDEASKYKGRLDDILECNTPYDLILTVASRIWVGERTEHDLARIFRASELLILSESYFKDVMLKILQRNYESELSIP